eukprot:6492099-Amphidinium_carterae.1
MDEFYVIPRRPGNACDTKAWREGGGGRLAARWTQWSSISAAQLSLAPSPSLGNCLKLRRIAEIGHLVAGAAANV